MSTTPTQPSFHGALPPRGLDATASSSISQGRFGRMFRHLPSSSPEDSSLADLAKVMIQELEPDGLDKELGVDDDDENTGKLANGELRLPAGYTYFGQFVDHDITFDPVSSLTRQNDPDGLVDFRTPRFDLDSLYGRGPSDQPYLYAPDGVHLALGREVPSPASTVGHDLQRDENGRALIGDPRNDENMIVSQLQATMIKFHNTVLDQVGSERPNLGKDEVFKIAQQQVRWHYQWVVVHDFVARLVGEEVVADILKPVPYAVPGGGEATIVEPDLKFYEWENAPYMPVEFSVGAYRFGHSMARPSYLINEIARKKTAVDGVHRIPLFEHTAEPQESLSGFQPLPDQWTVQWRFLLSGVEDAPDLPQPSYKIDAQLSHPLGALPDAIAAPEVMALGLEPDLAQVLAARNLFRAKRLGLPSGQDVALAMGIEPLTDVQLFGGENVQGLQQSTRDDLAGRAPLWFYVLKEAEVVGSSEGLGPVGGRIVAEVLIGLLAGDPLSFLGVRPNWKPTLPSATPGQFTLSDLVKFAIPTPGSPPPPPPYGG
jgi:Animal haem peroxidase